MAGIPVTESPDDESDGGGLFRGGYAIILGEDFAAFGGEADIGPALLQHQPAIGVGVLWVRPKGD